MEVFVVLWIIISIIGAVVGASKKKAVQTRQQPRPVMTPREGAPVYEGAPRETEEQRRARQEELKRKLLENQAKRLVEQAKQLTQTAAAPAASLGERRPLEKRVMESNLKKEKPVVAHADDDCGGGSIHDGFHEGVTQFRNRTEASVAGRLGRRLADEDERIEREAAAAENAKRALARIAKLPPLAQGMVYSEILGKPRSEIA